MCRIRLRILKRIDWLELHAILVTFTTSFSVAHHLGGEEYRHCGRKAEIWRFLHVPNDWTVSLEKRWKWGRKEESSNYGSHMHNSKRSWTLCLWFEGLRTISSFHKHWPPSLAFKLFGLLGRRKLAQVVRPLHVAVSPFSTKSGLYIW